MPHARPAIPKAAIAAAALMALGALTPAVVSPAAAQDALVPTPAPEGPRPYPYAVLGQQPGGLPGPTHEALKAELGADILLRPEEIVMQLPAPDGRIFEFTFPQYLQTPRPVYAGLGGDDETYDRFGLLLATDALEGRVLGISRNLRAPNTEVPDFAALRAQLVGLYGEPSDERDDGRVRVMIWAWADDGFIEDLHGQPERSMQFETATGEIVPVDYRPCVKRNEADLQYGFAYPRKGPAYPGCVATYAVAHTTDMGFSTIDFSVSDFELGRLHREAADAQLIDWLLQGQDEDGEPADPEPSNMKL